VTTAGLWAGFEKPAPSPSGEPVGSEHPSTAPGEPLPGFAQDAGTCAVAEDEEHPERSAEAREQPESRATASENPERSPGGTQSKDAGSPCVPSSTTRFDVHYDDNHWNDPRPDLAAGQPTWAAVLKAAWQLDGDEQDGCFGVLHGLRGQGAALEPLATPEWAREKFGSLPRWKLARGEIDAAQWEAWERQWLDPVQARVMQVLAGV
jgi:hypothetical protein